ncbi:MAG: hypothetical protein ACRDHE_12115, partial [Ktedonobacterales bacterium]
DEYGLIVCGWSAAWDVALRAALERAPGRRYSTYWSTRSPLGVEAQRLVLLRRAEVISGKDANALFVELLERVRDLGDLDRSPLTKDMAVARAKRYLEEGNGARIRLHDLVMEETGRVYEQINGPEFPSGGHGRVATAELARRLERYTIICDTLLALVIAGCRWGTADQESLWVASLERVVPADYDRGFGALGTLRSYPALLLLYGGCLAALAGERYDTVAALLLRVRVRDLGKGKSIFRQLDPTNMLQVEDGRQIPGLTRSAPAGSDYVFRTLRTPLCSLLPDDAHYEQLFDFFEYLYALLHADARLEAGDPLSAPVGRFARNREFRRERLPALTEEIATMGSEWPLLRAGLFGGSLELLNRVKLLLDQEMFSPGPW